MSKHTPGPWSKKAIATILRYASKNDGLWTEECREDEFIPDSADASMIVAAPDLLEALEEALDNLDDPNFWAAKARAAIAKAKGEV